MVHTHQAFEVIGEVLAALIIGSHIREETWVWALNDPSLPLPLPTTAFSNCRAIGVLVLQIKEVISHSGGSNHADFMFYFFQMSSLPRRAKLKVQTAVPIDEFSSFSEL